MQSNKRHVLFVDDAFFVIVDEIELAEPDVIDFRLHALSPFTTGQNEAKMQGEKAGMRVLFDQDMLMSQSDVFDGADPAEVERLPTQYHLCATTRHRTNHHRLVSVLYPYAAGEEKSLTLNGDTICMNGRSWKLVKENEKYTIL